MKQLTVWPLIAAVGLFTALPAAWAAPGDPATPAAPAAAPTNAAPPVRGRVTATDATAKTVTLTVGRTQTSATFTVNEATKYLVDVPGKTTDLKVGQTIMVNGQTDANTVTARNIQIVPASEVGQGGQGGRRRGVEGVIATITPTITIKTTDGQTDTVTTDDTTRVTTSKPGTFKDVAVGTFVTATTTGTGDTQVATSVHVRQGFGGGGRNGGGGGNGGGGNGGGGNGGGNTPPAAPPGA